MRRDIVFVHIPKTAGTSLRKMLEQSGSDHTILRDYGNSPATTPQLYDLVHRQDNISMFRETFDEGDRGILLSGHFPARRYWDFFCAESFATFVRHPVDRVLSEYNHYVNHHGWTDTLESFVSDPRFRNTMSKFLADVEIERFGFIGVTETFETILPSLEAFVETRLIGRRANVGNYDNVPSAVNPNHRSMIAALNRNDIELYDRLRATRAKSPYRPHSGGSAKQDFRGRVRRMGKFVAGGWLCHSGDEFIAKVQVLIDGRVATTVQADRYERKIKKKGISRTGIGGFRVDLRPLLSFPRAHESSLAFKAEGTEYELEGSPLTI